MDMKEVIRQELERAEEMDVENIERQKNELLDSLERKYNFMTRGNPDLNYRWQAIIYKFKMNAYDRAEVERLIEPEYKTEIGEMVSEFGDNYRIY